MARAERLIASVWPIFQGGYASRLLRLFGSAVVGYWPLSDGPKGNNYLTLNGSTSYVDCGSSANLDDLHDGEFTVDFWMWQDPSQQVTAIPVSKASGTTGWVFYTLPQSTVATFRVYDNASDYVEGTAGYEPGGWVHCTGYFNDGGDRKAYIALNGNWSEDSLTLSNPIGSDDAINLNFGRKASGSANWFKGKIGWVRISHGDRLGVGVNFTPPARDTIPTVDANTVGLWAMNEGYGTKAGDLGPNDNDGTIYNGDWPAYPSALDLSGNGRNGTYTGASLANALAPKGGGAPYFDGINDLVSINAANAAIDLDHGTAMGWIKAENAGVWEDGTARNLIRFSNLASEYIYFRKQQTGSVFRVQRGANSVTKGVQMSISSTSWNHVAAVWDTTTGLLNLYINAVAGTPVTGNVPIAGTVPNASFIGAAGTPAVEPWQGWLAHVLVLNRAATAEEIAKAYQWGV